MYFNDYMLPDQWHYLLNVLWTLQTFIAMFGCISYGLYFPQNSEIKWKDLPPVVRQFKFLLYLNTTFYIIELFSTRMLVEHHSMALHHLVAMTIFITTLCEPHMVCVCSLLPYLMHNIHWALQSQYEIILYFYNAYFFALGIWSTLVGYNSLLCKLSILLPVVNYYSYCVFYDGNICYDNTIISNIIACCSVLPIMMMLQ